MTERRLPRLLDRPDAVWAGALCLALAILYGMTLCPTVYWYDSAEFAAHAASLGVPHPPGYPLYTMIAHVFTWLPGEAALGVNIMSAFSGIVSAVMLYQLGRRAGCRPAGATVGAMMLATSYTFWGNAVVAEVYTPGLVFTLGAALLLEHADATKRLRPAILAGLVGGAGLGMHMSIATFGLGYVWLLLGHGIAIEPRRPWIGPLLRQDWPRRLRATLGAGLAAAVGSLVYVYVPLASFERWDRVEWIIFRKNLAGGAFKRKFMKEYDFGERFDLTIEILVNNLQWTGLALAAAGLLLLLHRRPKLGVFAALAAGGNLWWFFNYRVPDLDVFYLPAMACLCLLAGVGVDGIAEIVARLRPRVRDLAWLGMAMPVWLVIRNYDAVDLSDAVEARQWGEKVCANVDGPARIVNFSMPNEWRYYAVLLYQQEAMGRCLDLEVWGKRDIRGKDLRVAVERGDPIYAFAQVGRLRFYDLEPRYGLYRVYPRSRIRRKRVEEMERERGDID